VEVEDAAGSDNLGVVDRRGSGQVKKSQKGHGEREESHVDGRRVLERLERCGWWQPLDMGRGP
jgi:hypothetical protein